MSLHLGSSKYDEHTVRKVISKQYFRYLHPLCSICFPGHREHAGLEDKARSHAGAGCHPISAAASGHASFPLRECHPAWISTAPRGSTPSRPQAAPARKARMSCRESSDVPPGKRRCPTRIWSGAGQRMLPPPWREGWCSQFLLGKPRLRVRLEHHSPHNISQTSP